MGFKKNNIIKNTSIIPNLIGVIALCLIFLLGVFALKNIEIFDFVLDLGIGEPKKIEDLKNFENLNDEEKQALELAKSGNKINILLIGVGGGDHEAPDLTDTIILASINTKTKLVSMLSIPRDLYVEYPNGTKNGKINGIYVSNKNGENGKDGGMKALEEKITEITGENIDYFINIDFQGFIDIIDTIGGIKIEILEDFVDYQYPDGNWGYKTLMFKKGVWVFDGENALKYARSRHSTSDFDRSMRQQQVIKAIKDKLSGSFFLKSPLKIKELYDVFIKRVYTNLNLTTIIKLAYLVNSSSNFEIVSSNLNNSCFYGSSSCIKGGFLYTPSRDQFGGMSVLLGEGTTINNLNDYELIKKYSNIVFNYAGVFSENYKINIFNSVKVSNLAGELGNNIGRYGFNIPKINSIGNTDEPYVNSVIYYNNISDDSVTLKALKLFFDGEIIRTQMPKFSQDDAKIEIVIGEDYLDNSDIFKF